MNFHLRRLRIRAYRGIEALDTRVIFPDGIPDAGMLINGANGEGKSSVLNAIRAALAAQDIGPDAIRLGHDRAEILIDAEDATVQRVITAKGSRLQVNDGAVRSPADWLATMLGTAAFDPFDILEKDTKKRKAAILHALPCRVTPDQVTAWLDGWTLDAPPDFSLHGLEVVEQIRKEFFARRGVENARVKEGKKEAEALEAGAPPAIPGALTVEEAEEKRRAAATAQGELAARARRVVEHGERTRLTRERAEKLRLDAKRLRDTPRPDDAIGQAIIADGEAARTACATADEIVAGLEAEYLKLRDRLEAALANARVPRKALEEVEGHALAHDAWLRKIAQTIEHATELERQAAELDEAVAATVEAAPTDAEQAAAAAVVAAALEEQSRALAARARAEHEAKISDARTRLAKASDDAGKLDAMVQKFAKAVPAELLETTDGVQGLTLEGDKIFLEGVDLDKLSGREQLLFAVEIARRLNARAKILIVDGLEKVDREHLPEFITTATAGGYQLIATRVVDGGGVVFEALEPTEVPS